MNWKAILDELLAERRQQLGEPPTDDDFIALRAGELTPEERDQLLDHAALDPDVAAELFDVLRFPESTSEETDASTTDDPEAEASDESEIDERWQAFRERLIQEGELPVKRPALHQNSYRRFLPLAAVFLLGVGSALIFGYLRPVDPPAKPRVNLPIVELLPVDLSDEGRGSGEGIALTAEAEGVVLTLSVPDLAIQPRPGPFSLEWTRADGGTDVLSGLEPGVGGVFVVDLPRIPGLDGQQELQLRDSEGQAVALFAFEIEAQP